jgi:hypothetical protein
MDEIDRRKALSARRHNRRRRDIAEIAVCIERVLIALK